MRTITVAEGTATVKINRSRADVHHRGHYIGRLTRLSNGLWRDLPRPHLLFTSPAEAAEDLVDLAAGASA